MTKPVPMLLWCPSCGERHYDVGEFADKPHHTHACQECGMVWRPAIVPTVGVYFLPGFKNGDEEAPAAIDDGPIVVGDLVGWDGEDAVCRVTRIEDHKIFGHWEPDRTKETFIPRRQVRVIERASPPIGAGEKP